MAVPSIKLTVLNPQIITDRQIDTESQINVCRDHATALSLGEPFCLHSFEGRCQKLSGINLKLAAHAMHWRHRYVRATKNAAARKLSAAIPAKT
jgi:hypothetical protein